MLVTLSSVYSGACIVCSAGKIVIACSVYDMSFLQFHLSFTFVMDCHLHLCVPLTNCETSSNFANPFSSHCRELEE
jgi:hypothetical protein